MKLQSAEQQPARSYRMVARARSAEQTAERILDAAVAVFWDRPDVTLSLDEVAQRAQVSVQTVIRRFGGREGLLAAAGEREMSRVSSERDPAAVKDLDGAVAQLVTHYERVGEAVVRMLGQEGQSPALREIADAGRAHHREWCEQVFAQALDRLAAEPRRIRLAQLVALCDVYVWKLLRHDSGLSRKQTEHALAGLLRPILEAA